MNSEAMRQAMYTVYAYISAFENHKITNATSSNLDMTGYIAELARNAIEEAENHIPYVKKIVEPKREWIGLTDEEAMQTWEGIIKYAPSEMRLKDFAQAIEAKLKERNT